jgi:hypothetical protein
MEKLHHSSWDRDILCADGSSNVEQVFNETVYVKNQTYEMASGFKVKICVLFYGGKS